MSYYRFIIALFICSFVSCDVDDMDNIVRDIEYSIPYEDTSISVTIYSERSYSTIQIGSHYYNVPKYNIFPKTPELKPLFSWPIVECTNKGTELVVCTNRVKGVDAGEMDILLARKEPDSDNWEIKKIYQTDSVKGRAMCPAIVVDRFSGRIYLFANYFKNIDVFGTYHSNDDVSHVYKYSDDDGKTWSPEYNLKQTWRNYYTQSYNDNYLFKDYQSNIINESTSLWSKNKINDVNIENIICVMSGRGITIDGILLVPSCVIMNGIWHSSLLIRENGCWHFSAYTPNPGDTECSIYLDNENRVVLDCRTEKTTRRKYYYSIIDDKFYETTPLKIDSYVQIYAEIVNDNGLFYMCFPDSPNNERKNLTFYGSLDGVNWKKIFLIDPSSASNPGTGYSSIISINNKLYISAETSEGVYLLDISSCRDAIRNNILNN